MFKKSMGYVKEVELLGDVSKVDFRKSLIYLDNGVGDELEFASEDVEILEELFELNGSIAFEKDVLSDDKGRLYRIELCDDGMLQLHLLDNKLEVSVSGTKFEINDDTLKSLESNLEVIGHFYEILAELPKVPDFNIKIVRETESGETTYFYACNNKETEEIDLVKVIFIGHHILEEEDYTRTTLSYEVYQDSLDAGSLKEVNPQELVNYVTGLTYNADSDVKCGDEDDCKNGLMKCRCEENLTAMSAENFAGKYIIRDEDLVEEEDICDDCDELRDECNCEDW